MDPLLAQTVLVLATVGNCALAISFLNRSHGVGAWRPLIHCCSGLALIVFLAGPLVVVATVSAASPQSLTMLPPRILGLLAEISSSRLAGPAAVYTVIAALASLLPVVTWWSYLSRRQPALVVSDHTKTCNLPATDQGESRLHGIGRMMAVFPANEIFSLDVSEKTLSLPRLPARLDGLSIAHLSDLHMSGRVGVGFFHDVVEKVAALKPDIVAITGDIVDRTPCLGWIRDTLGRLIAPYGVYYVLGNHDLHVDTAALHAALAQVGLQGLGGRQRTLEIAGETVLLAGNERPWTRAPREQDSRLEQLAPSPALRVLLSHSPDQIGWARRHQFDLMLAGHTHGGQIRFPGIGPLLVPSLYGTKYASGTFYEPPTLLHVSRGVSGLTPVRYNCRPEISVLRLKCTSPVRPTAETSLPDAESVASWT